MPLEKRNLHPSLALVMKHAAGEEDDGLKEAITKLRTVAERLEHSIGAIEERDYWGAVGHVYIAMDSLLGALGALNGARTNASNVRAGELRAKALDEARERLGQ